MKIPEIALVGIGGYAGTHYLYLKKLHQAGKIKLSSVMVRAQDQKANEKSIEDLSTIGAELFSTHEELLQKHRPDMVVLPVGIAFHRDLSCFYLNAGINVLVEKPAAGSVADVGCMIDAEKKSGVFAAVGFQNMYGSDIHFLKKEIISGKYGKLRNISVSGAWLRADAYYTRNNWAGKLYASDGTAILDSPANNAFAHFINNALFLAGREFDRSAHAVAMQAELFRARRSIESFDSCTIRLKSAEGVLIQVLLTHCCSRKVDPELKIELDDAVMYWSNAAWKITGKNGKILASGEGVDSREEMYLRLIRKLEGKQEFYYSLENALEHTFCIEKMHENFRIKELPEKDFCILHDQDNQHVIPGIEELFARAYDKNLLLFEVGAPWSEPVEWRNL